MGVWERQDTSTDSLLNHSSPPSQGKGPWAKGEFLGISLELYCKFCSLLRSIGFRVIFSRPDHFYHLWAPQFGGGESPLSSNQQVREVFYLAELVLHNGKKTSEVCQTSSGDGRLWLHLLQVWKSFCKAFLSWYKGRSDFARVRRTDWG